MRLAERGRQGDVEHVLVVPGGGPHPDVALAGRRLHADREQVPREEPLNRFLHADMEGHPDGVGIVIPVAQTGRQRDPTMLGDDEPEPEFCCHGSATAHLVPKPLRPVPNVCVVVLIPGVPGQPRSSTAAWGPPAPITRSAGEDPRDAARSSPRVTCQQIGARRAGSIPAWLPESPPTRGFEQGFSCRESGHFRICSEEIRPCLNPLAHSGGPGRADGRAVRHGPPPRGAVIGTAFGPDALVCGGQRPVDPALARAIGSAGERLVHTEEVTGSIPVSPTKSEYMSIFPGITAGAIPAAKSAGIQYGARHGGQARLGRGLHLLRSLGGVPRPGQPPTLPGTMAWR